MTATVGVNLLWLVPGVVGGSEEYTLRLLRAVDQLDVADLSLRLYAQPELTDAHPDLLQRFEVVHAPKILSSKAARIVAEHTWLARATRNDDLVHHAGGVIPTVGPTPAVVTIHDLQPLDMPEHFGVARRRWLNLMLPRTATAAKAVLCPSAFSTGRVHELLNVEPERLVVVPHGHEPVTPGVLDSVAHEDNLARFGRFVLLPAIAYLHKRHIDVVHAVDELRQRGHEFNIVFTGRPGPRTEAVQNRAQQLGMADRCHVLGRVSETELDGLYRSAFALAFPSIYEGFGNPVLEAMARGCPVVAARAGSVPEVAGDAALLVEPKNVHELADALERLVDNAQLRTELVSAGVERAQEFGWVQAGEALLNAYRCALP